MMQLELHLNGYGFFWGMISGIAAALIAPMIMGPYFPGVHEIYGFPAILFVSLVGCILGSLLTQPDGEVVLKQFYRTVRPWGFWRAIYEKVKQEDPNFEKNRPFPRDCFNVLVGMIWQACLMMLPIYIVLQEKTGIVATGLIVVVTSAILKKSRLDRMEDEPAE